MANLSRTVLYQRHVDLGAQMVEFGGWEMPVQYPEGILAEHLSTRNQAGLFDVSHMGRFIISGREALSFLQHTLTNNAAALQTGQSQYTLLADPNGFALDDAFLYRFFEDSYLLVVNAANRRKDWNHIQSLKNQFRDVIVEDHTEKLVMVSLQGPKSKEILNALIGENLGEPQRNALFVSTYNGSEILVGRTGYTGEPLCFELFIPAQSALSVWDTLLQKGASPVGLGARDTLRLEAALPLYGHELGQDPEGCDIPIFAIDLGRIAVSFSPLKGMFIGRSALERQFKAFELIIRQHSGDISALARRIRPFELIDKGIARAGAKVYYHGNAAGYVTSGTMVPYWEYQGPGLHSRMTGVTLRRAIGMALIDSRIPDASEVDIEVRGKKLRAGIMPYLLRSEAPPMARAITWSDYGRSPQPAEPEKAGVNKIRYWVQKSIDNTIWRRNQCINLIPSEMTMSPLVRMLSIMDPAGRYAEHKTVKAFFEEDIFYYQGTDFIQSVEKALVEQLCLFLACNQVETRPISGQMANMVVFSALVDFLNRANRKVEQRRIQKVMNHHIIKGGHLSAQPMGALRDFVMRDPQTERPAVVNLPVLSENPYQVDIEACGQLLEIHKPELIILGKSMILYKEPVAEIRRLIDQLNLNTVLMYDMAHVLGLTGPYFQEPFAEGADIVTGSTHKTLFGTQRGLVAANMTTDQASSQHEFWEAIVRRAFPGSVSNHHLGTLLGLLAAAIEMNTFRDPYQQTVITNAKAFAKALHTCGLSVAGDAALDYTQTHQVIVEVGYAKGPQIAKALEDNNIICNFQATPREEGFTASGALRLGVAEMTRFGMDKKAFEILAQLMADIIRHQKNVKQAVLKLRTEHLQLRYCFSTTDLEPMTETLYQLVQH